MRKTKRSKNKSDFTFEKLLPLFLFFAFGVLAFLMILKFKPYNNHYYYETKVFVRDFVVTNNKVVLLYKKQLPGVFELIRKHHEEHKGRKADMNKEDNVHVLFDIRRKTYASAKRDFLELLYYLWDRNYFVTYPSLEDFTSYYKDVKPGERVFYIEYFAFLGKAADFERKSMKENWSQLAPEIVPNEFEKIFLD